MTALSRRSFLLGTTAAVASAALPPVPIIEPLKLYEGYIGTYQGIRIVDVQRAADWLRSKKIPAFDGDYSVLLPSRDFADDDS